MEVSRLRYPKKSHRKAILIPKESAKLAELLGIIFGDGGINNQWQIVISLNATADRQYATYVQALFKQLFSIETARRERKKNTLVVVASSTTLVDFIVQKGAVRGNKILQGIDIPSWVLRREGYKRSFVRGLVDTDGCLYIHNHTVRSKAYSNIGFCFTSGSPALIRSVEKILRENGLKPSITDRGRRIYLYSQKGVLDYLKIFGSSNPRIFQKYNEWRGARVAESAALEMP